MIEIVRRTSRNVKRWQDGDMALRWTAAGMLEAERQFRRIIGYRDLAKLVIAIERTTSTRTHRPDPDRGGRYARHRLTVTPGPPSEVPRRAGHPRTSHATPSLAVTGWEAHRSLMLGGLRRSRQEPGRARRGLTSPPPAPPKLVAEQRADA